MCDTPTWPAILIELKHYSFLGPLTLCRPMHEEWRDTYYLYMCKHSLPTLSLPSPVPSHLCAKQVFPKDKLLPKQSAAMGGAPTCQHSMHTHKSSPGYLSAITRTCLKLSKNAMQYTVHTEISVVLQPLCGRYFFSQSGLQASLTTMSRLVKPTPVEEVKREGEEKKKKSGPGERPN